MSRSSEITHPSPDVDPEVLIRVNKVSKKFCRDFKKSLWYGLRDTAADILHPKHSSEDSKLRPSEFWANQKISFEVKRGECLGLIGHNGAGKTTLLKMLNGLIKPDTGSIEMWGRLGALIALGAGFNPILTGRENIYINGSVLGLTRKEIDAKIDDIINFAEIEDAIDAPVRTYSSGMQVRLGFSIASSLDPDVLILDEVLAVGDAGFVVKCLNRVRELAQNSAIIFVSHQMQYVSNFCTRVIVMDQGMPLLDTSNPGEGINCYYGQMKFIGSRSGTGNAKLESFEIFQDDTDLGSDPVINQGQDIQALVGFSVDGFQRQFIVRVLIDDEAQTPIIAYPLIDYSGDIMRFDSGRYKVKVPLGEIDLNAGVYSFMVAIIDDDTQAIELRESGIAPFSVVADRMMWSKVVRPVKVDFEKVDISPVENV